MTEFQFRHGQKKSQTVCLHPPDSTPSSSSSSSPHLQTHRPPVRWGRPDEASKGWDGPDVTSKGWGGLDVTRGAPPIGTPILRKKDRQVLAKKENLREAQPTLTKLDTAKYRYMYTCTATCINSAFNLLHSIIIRKFKITEYYTFMTQIHIMQYIEIGNKLYH